MCSWSEEQISKYAEAGGFWVPENGAAQQPPAAQTAPPAQRQQQPLSAAPANGAGSYRKAAVALDSPQGQELAASMSDSWVARMTALMDAFEPQGEPGWCGLAACAIALRVLLSPP